jgi:hypothetical protein
MISAGLRKSLCDFEAAQSIDGEGRTAEAFGFLGTIDAGT